MSRPLLSQYPHLRQILKDDPIANQQFNQVLSGIRSGVITDVKTTEQDLRQTTERLNLLLKTREEERTRLEDQRTVITLLGETIEPQVHLRPYTQDIAKDSHYDVTFSAHEIREILRLHWRLIAEEAEATIRGSATTNPDDNSDD